MPISRRQLIRATGGTLGVAGVARALPRSASARERGAVVLVRAGGGVRAVDPRTGDITAWRGSLPATPAPEGAAAAPVPETVVASVTEGSVTYWMAAPSAAAFVFRIDTGATSGWWWRREGGRSVALELAADLEPAFPSGTSARWFHGATVDAAHLGAGSLRLLAVDIDTGEIALDRVLDRRLELAATAVSVEGAAVAHVQSSTTGVTFLAADLRGGTRLVDAACAEHPGLAAASSIDLAVAADGDAVLAAAGVVADWPGAPGPSVCLMWSASTGAVRTMSVPGDLIGIVTPDAIDRL